jgi:alpha-amylase
MSRFPRSAGFLTAALLAAAVVSCGGDGGPDFPAEVCGTRPAGVSAPAWASGAVFYEVFVRSFADSDGDGIGDLRGLIQRLDYLNDGRPGGTDLGIDALWLMPIFTAASYHGYDTVDYESIDPQYGTMADFQQLVSEADRRGIRIILDLVLNHTSNRHPWFTDSARRDHYVWSSADLGWRQPWLNGGPVWHQGASGYYYGLFWSGMPDLNFTNPAVRGEMIRLANLWLSRGAAGFRLDAVRYLVETGSGNGQQDTAATHGYWKELRAGVKSRHPEAFLVGEAWADAAVIGRYYGQLDELDANFDFPVQEAIIRGIQNRSGATLERALCDVARQYPEGAHDALFLGNHDMARVAQRLEGDESRMRLAATALLTLPGTPFIYYGEEIGMGNGELQGGDINFRTPMQWSGGRSAGFTSGLPWLPVNSDAPTRNVELQLGDASSLLSHYRAMIALRAAHAALRHGDIALLRWRAAGHTDQLVAFARRTAEQAVLVVLNFGNQAPSDLTVDLTGLDLGSGPVLDAVSGAAAGMLSGGAADLAVGSVPAFGWRVLLLPR